MQEMVRPPAARQYAIALGVVAAALAGGYLFTPLLGRQTPYIFFFPAVAAAAWYGGFRPGVTVVILTAIASEFLLLEPAYSFVIAQPADLVGLLLFVVMGLMISTLGERAIRAAGRASFREAELQTTLNSIGDGVIVTDTYGRITGLNPSAERLTGWREHEAVGRQIADVFQVRHELTNAHLEDPVQTVLRTGEIRTLSNHAVLVARDRQERPIDQTASPVRRRDGSLAGAVLIFRDVTERRRAARALEQSAAALAETNRQKDVFLATLAHELRNPLAPIRNGVELLSLSRTRGDADHILGMIRRQLAHMARLLDDLLDVSRFTQGKIELRSEDVDLAAVIASALESSRPDIDRKGHRLDLALPKGLRVWGDPTRLAQVFVNLTNNAAKFTDAGGRISVQAACEGEEAVVRVADTGRGIRAETLPHVFDAFKQVEASSGAERGLGIGLSLVRQLVELHGGSVSVTSAGAGLGSEFVVRLPLRRSDAPDVARDDRAGRIAGQPAETRRRVLVVDDNIDSAESMSALLEMQGHEVHAVYDGPSALTAAGTFRPDVVLLDLGLPGMSGLEVCRALRAQGFAGTRIVAMTGYGTGKDRLRTEEAGFDAHLVKPVDIAMLLPMVAAGSHETSR
jgi:PAS domain S-box-containing protein